MSNNQSLVFKVASEPWEFEQIHGLNYQTFVHEIPQHQQNETQKLVDRYHEENTYVICLRDGELLGMIALRDKRPLSLDHKLADLESYLPPFKRILEYRLLAVKQQHRNTAIFTGIDHFNELLRMLCERVNAPHVQLMMGSGTLANDVVAAR